MEKFTVEVKNTPFADVVSLTGDADMYVAPELRSALETVVRHEPPAAVVDMGALTFVDSTTLGLLLMLERSLDAAAVPLMLVCDNHAVLRAFQVTGLDRRFRIVPTLTDALRDARVLTPAAA